MSDDQHTKPTSTTPVSGVDMSLDEEDRGLLYDLPVLLERRRALMLFGSAGLAALAACSASPSTGTPSASATGTSAADTSGASTSSALTEVPDETAGPYPGDDSNGVNVLDDTGIVRSDITSSFGSTTAKAEGVPLTVRLTVKDVATSQALVGAAVYLWHADAQGRYSMYSQGVSAENYLRGVQSTEVSGTATFTSVYPGCYDGRWPHIHFEVYRSVEEATAAGQIVKTSQIALPQATCEQVYASNVYPDSAGNLAKVSLSTDNVFREDSGTSQLATMSGDTASGYTAARTIGV
ncbi:MAG TPA: hypothetical protein VHM65_04685 [Candidatus Lustribacter sp.]|nr:hypothetical protein [Candidatus Lustribacter sp.]